MIERTTNIVEYFNANDILDAYDTNQLYKFWDSLRHPIYDTGLILYPTLQHIQKLKNYMNELNHNNDAEYAKYSFLSDLRYKLQEAFENKVDYVILYREVKDGTSG